MSKILDTGKMGGAEGQRLEFKGFDVGNGQRLARKTYELKIPTKNKRVGSSSLGMTEGQLLAALRILLAKNTIRFGGEDDGDEQFDAETMDYLRLYAAWADWKDWTYISSAGVRTEFGDNADNPAFTIADGATGHIVVHVSVPYINRNRGDRRQWDGCPGQTQMRKAYVCFERGAGFDDGAPIGTYFVQDGDVTCVVRADTFAGRDAFARPPRWFRDPNSDKTESQGVKGEAHLVLEMRAPAATNDMESVDVLSQRQGSDGKLEKVVLHSNVDAAELYSNADRYSPDAGARDLNKFALVVWRPLPGLPPGAAIIGTRTFVKQRASEPQSLNLAFLYTPLSDTNFETTVGMHATTKGGTGVLLTPQPAIENPAADPIESSVAPLVITAPESTDFDTLSGTAFRQEEGKSEPTITLKVPEVVKQRIAQSIDAAPDSSKASVAKKALAGLGKSIPGAIAPAQSTTAQANGTSRIATIGKLLGAKIAQLAGSKR